MARRNKSGSGTPATVALDRAGIRYSLHPYQHDPAAAHYGEEAAELLGVDPTTIFKTLVVDSGAGLAVAVVPVAGQLDPKALATVLAVKKVGMADPQVAARSSGYVVGGISPIGQRTALTTVIDDSARDQELIMVSAGRRGLQLQLAPDDLRRVTEGRYATIARWSPQTR